jgi:glycosyltransferase involved in cell wall biosynthesis
MNILWLRPDKPANISVGRHRIGLELRERGHDIEIRNTTPGEFRGVLGDEPDIVVGTTRLGAFVGAWKHLTAGTPLLVDHIDPIEQLRRSHGPLTTWAVDKVEKATFRVADHVMIVYETELPRVQRHASHVTHTALGVDYETFSDPPEETVTSARERVRSHASADSEVLLYVGGLEPPYHLPAVVDALDHLEDWELVVLGDGSQRDWLEGVDDERSDVHYLGTVPYESVPGYMHVADVGITLLDDANTLKVLEYGAARLPVVHVEGEGEGVFEGKVVFCSLDPADVARAIEQSMGRETDSLASFARERRWTAIADEYETVLERLVAD